MKKNVRSRRLVKITYYTREVNNLQHYNEKVLKFFMNPRNVGGTPGTDVIGEVGNPRCRDRMKKYLDINENEVIRGVKFETFGCTAAIATSSMVTEMLKGLTVDEALNITDRDVVKEVGGLPFEKVHCSLLTEEAPSGCDCKLQGAQSGDIVSSSRNTNCGMFEDFEEKFIVATSREG